MGKNILVIDDEAIITRSIQKLLTKEGLSATVAKSGKEAVKKVGESDFDLIVCDVRMPDMDGIETIKAIRNRLKEIGKATVPEIIITGYADESRYREAVELKVAGYIYKPFDISEFLAVIKEHLK